MFEFEINLLNRDTNISHIVYLDDDAVIEMGREVLEGFGIKLADWDIRVSVQQR
jgi:acetoacetate decarboxylase